jgi:hypothetical protein
MMGLQEDDAQSLEELDAADEQEVERVEGVVLQVVAEEHPSTVSDLSSGVRARVGQIDNSVIRAAILRLLNGNRLQIGNGHQISAVP